MSPEYIQSLVKKLHNCDSCTYEDIDAAAEALQKLWNEYVWLKAHCQKIGFKYAEIETIGSGTQWIEDQ